MDQNTLVARFSAFCGLDQFQRFVTELNTRCGHKRRLLFWQEQLWRRFADTQTGVPTGFEEIADSLRLCPLHLERLRSGEVPVLYGYVGHDEDYRKAHQEKFPFAREVVLGGCCGTGHETAAVTDYCASCRYAYQTWSQEKERKRARRRSGVPEKPASPLPALSMLPAAVLWEYLKWLALSHGRLVGVQLNPPKDLVGRSDRIRLLAERLAGAPKQPGDATLGVTPPVSNQIGDDAVLVSAVADYLASRHVGLYRDAADFHQRIPDDLQRKALERILNSRGLLKR